MDDARAGIRPEIQALRAVAVLLVVVYHLWPTRLTGGYVGVDVFFVVSGFLITSHLVREVERTGRVSLTQFWARRIRRLLPASFTVLLASLVATVIWLPRSVWEQTFQEIGGAALYVINWVLAANAVDYLAADNVPSIVQHYWSLAVEEQFYLVWPALILGAVTMAVLWTRRRGHDMASAPTIRTIVLVLGVVAAASFAWSIIETSRSQPWAYFVTPTRAWEFAVGGLLAFIPVHASQRLSRTHERRIRAIACWLGLVAILAASVRLSAGSSFPGWIAAVPVLGAALIVWAGDVHVSWSPTSLAGFAPIQLVGDLSYGIYLWHWPLIVLYPHITGHPPELRGGLAIALLSVALAWVTKRVIEDPVRRRPYWTTSRRRSYALAGGLMSVTLVLAGSGIYRLDRLGASDQLRIAAGLDGQISCFGAAVMLPGSDCPRPFAIPTGLDPAVARADMGFLARKSCRNGEDTARVVRCEIGDPSGIPGVALVGNSHAAALASGLDPLARELGWRLRTYVRLGCLGVSLEQIADDPTPACVEWTRAVTNELIGDPTIQTVVYQSYVAAAPRTFDHDQRVALRHMMQATWRRLMDAGKHVIVVNDVPGMRPQLAPDCIADAGDVYDPCTRPVNSVALTNLMFQAAQETPGVTAIDVHDLLCDRTVCHSMIGGVVAYFDAHHMTGTFATTLLRLIAPRFQAVVRP